MQSKGDLRSGRGEPVREVFTDPSVSQYEAEGLPKGLSIDTATGIVTGVPTQFETAKVTIRGRSAANSVAVWGEGVGGALGQGVDEKLLKQLTWVGVPGLTRIKKLAGGGQSSAAVLLVNGTIVHWGGGTFGSAGDNTQTDKFAPHVIPLPEKAVDYQYGGGGVVLLESGKVMTFGSNAGQVAVGGGVSRFSPTYAERSEGVLVENAVAIASGHFTSLILVETAGKQELLRAGKVESLGANLFAELEPTEGATGWGSTEKVVKVQITFGFMACQLANGELRLKGMNDFGQMGDGTVAAKADKNWHTALVKAGEPLKVKDFEISEFNVVALMADGSVRCWGRNHRGQIGNGEVDPLDENPVATPTVPVGNPIVTSVSSGGSQASGGVVGDWFTICCKADGTLVGWGGNSDGELALGHRRLSEVPVPIAAGITDAVEVGGNVSHVICLRTIPPTAVVVLTATPVAGTKNIRLQWTVPTGDRLDHFKLQWRHVENSPVTGKAESPKHDAKSLNLKPSEVIVAGYDCEYVVVNPAVAPAWSPHSNLMEFELEAAYTPPTKPTAETKHISGSKWKIEWPEEEGPSVYDFATETTHPSPEPGWVVRWREKPSESFLQPFHAFEESPPVTVGTTNSIEVQYSANGKPLPTTTLEASVEGAWSTLWQTRVVTAVPAEMGAEIPWLPNPNALPQTEGPHTKPQANVVVMTSGPSATTSTPGLVTVTKGAQIGEEENAKKELVPIYEWKLEWPLTKNKKGESEPGWIVRWRESEQEFWTNYNHQTEEYEAVPNASAELAAGATTLTITTYVAKDVPHAKFPPEVRVEGTRTGVGDLLKVVPAKWENEPLTESSYQWVRHNNPPPGSEAFNETVPGATGATYRVLPIDVDSSLMVQEQPTNGAGKLGIYPKSHALVGAPSQVVVSG